MDSPIKFIDYPSSKIRTCIVKTEEDITVFMNELSAMMKDHGAQIICVTGLPDHEWS